MCKNTPEHDTYSVSLCFDDAFSEKIRAIVRELSSVTKNDHLLGDDAVVHLTLGMFHVPKGGESQIRSRFLDFAKEISHPLKIAFSAADSFLDKVIFLSVDHDEKSFPRLKELNILLHEKMVPDFEPGANKNYVPGRFFPHIALAAKLTREQCERGMAALSEECSLSAMIGPCIAKVRSVSLAHCHPYKETLRLPVSTDSLTPSQRHTVMSHIKSTGGSLETALRSQLFSFGFRFRKNDRRLSGSPDIVFVHYRAVIFVNGCFWHAHGWKSGESLIRAPVLDENVLYSLSCDKFRMPGTNGAFWNEKFRKNRARDIRDIESLLSDGWRVGVVWECSILGKKRAEKIRSVAEAISFWLEDEQSVLFREF